MRSVGIGLALLAGMVLPAGIATVAWGQIAAPSIVPGTLSSENPAAIKWGAPSRLGAAAVSQRDVDNPGNHATAYAGASGGFRLVGETLALGAEGLHLEDQESNLHDVRDSSSAALALQTGNSIAWGLGYNTFKQTLNTVKTNSREPDFGISLRLGEVWFVGGTVGRESLSHKDALLPAADFYGERDVLRAGLGFRRGGTVLVHVEAFAINKPDFDTKTQGKFGGEDTSGGTLEFTFWSFLLGGSTRHTQMHHALTDTIDHTTGDVGWAPRGGFSLTLHYEETRVAFIQQPTDLVPPKKVSTLESVVLAYLF